MLPREIQAVCKEHTVVRHCKERQKKTPDTVSYIIAVNLCARGEAASEMGRRLDKTNIIHVPIGKASFTEEQLSDNFQTLIGAIVKARPSTLKGQYLKSVVIAPTMGPGVKINPIKLA